jgi:hypothetical protein
MDDPMQCSSKGISTDTVRREGTSLGDQCQGTLYPREIPSVSGGDIVPMEAEGGAKTGKAYP